MKTRLNFVVSFASFRRSGRPLFLSKTGTIMRNMVIDMGNTSTKVGLFDDDEIVHFQILKEFSVEELVKIAAAHSVHAAIFSSVVKVDPEALALLAKELPNFVLLDADTPLPIENLYATPKTLGCDRIAACVGANYLMPNTNLLVIDAGTAVTYDIVNSKNQYVGGNISLGLEMRAKALHDYTSKLPKVEVPNHPILCGSTTETALQAGILTGLTCEIDGFIDSFSMVYPNLSVFLTGGSTFYFERSLKNAIFANDKLLLIGLNRILTYSR